MSAVACLRVVIDGNRTEVPAERLGPLVAKYANIFLEVRWTFPRMAEQLSYYSYLLSDPVAAELATAELAQLSQDLQDRLFGTGAEDAVKLVLFEGDEEAIAAFVSYSAEEVVAAMDDPSGLPRGARLRRIASDGSLIDIPEAAACPPIAEALRFGPTIDGAQGIYFPAAGAFIGDVVNCTPEGAPHHFSMADGKSHRPDDAEAFDAACVMTVIRFLVESPGQSQIFLPISFSTLVRPCLREAWLNLAAVLPPTERGRLAASVYDVPRAPTFQSLTTIHEALYPYFGSVHLCVTDPNFHIAQLAKQAVASVTLALPEGKSDVRLAAIRRFASYGAEYRMRRMAAGITDLRTAEERALAIELSVPFLSGTAICRVQDQLVGGRPYPVARLPLTSTPSPRLEKAATHVVG